MHILNSIKHIVIIINNNDNIIVTVSIGCVFIHATFKGEINIFLYSNIMFYAPQIV